MCHLRCHIVVAILAVCSSPRPSLPQSEAPPSTKSSASPPAPRSSPQACCGSPGQHRTHRIEWFQNAGERLRARSGEPGWSSIPTMFVASSLIVALLGFLWDVSLHAGRGRDAGPLANPAHYLILYGLFALFVAGMSAVVYPRDGEKPGIASVRITRQWYAPVSGIFIAGMRRLRPPRLPARRRLAPPVRPGRHPVGPDPPHAHRRRRPLDRRHHPAPPRDRVLRRVEAAHAVAGLGDLPQVRPGVGLRRPADRPVGVPGRVRLRRRPVPHGARADDDRALPGR